jgi:hypothetical protein
MGQPIPAQHPSVVLRSHFNQVRTLLIVAMAAVCALAAVVVIQANDHAQVSSAAKAPAIQQTQTQLPAGTRFDGGPDEGTRGLAAQRQLPAGTRFDGGPDEGTRGATSYYSSPAQRSSYQPAKPDGFKDRAGGPRMIPQGPGAR